MNLPKFRIIYQHLETKKFFIEEVKLGDPLKDVYPAKIVDVLQYQNIFDKKGKEFCEGDVVSTSWNHADTDKWEKEDQSYTVIPSQKKLNFTLYWHIDSEDEDSIYHIQYCEIEGNMYINPELLEKCK